MSLEHPFALVSFLLLGLCYLGIWLHYVTDSGELLLPVLVHWFLATMCLILVYLGWS